MGHWILCSTEFFLLISFYVTKPQKFLLTSDVCEFSLRKSIWTSVGHNYTTTAWRGVVWGRWASWRVAAAALPPFDAAANCPCASVCDVSTPSIFLRSDLAIAAYQLKVVPNENCWNFGKRPSSVDFLSVGDSFLPVEWSKLGTFCSFA